MLFASAIAYLSLADLGWLAPRIEQMVMNASGRKLTIDGAFELRLLPMPTLLAEDVSFANADWGAAPQMVTAQHVSARVDLWSIVVPPLRVEQVRAEGVSVSLEQNEAGDANWTMSTVAEPETTELPALPDRTDIPVIQQAELRDIRISLQSPGVEDRTLRLEQAVIALDADGYQTLSIRGALQDLEVTLSGRVGGLAGLETGRRIDVDLKAAVGDLALALAGSPGSAEPLTINVVSEDVAPLLARLGLDLPLQGPFELTGTIDVHDQGFGWQADIALGDTRADVQGELSGNEVTFAATTESLNRLGKLFGQPGLPDSKLAVDGRLEVTRGRYELHAAKVRLGSAQAELSGVLTGSTNQLTLEARGEAMSELGFDLPQVPYQLMLEAKVDPEKLTLEPFELQFADSDLAGALTITQVQGLGVAGRFESKNLDFSPFMDDESEAAADAAVTESRDYVFENQPDLFQLLPQAFLELEATVARLVVTSAHYTDVIARVALHGGSGDMDLALSGRHGGRLRASAKLDNQSDAETLSLHVDAKDLRFEALWPEAGSPQQIPPTHITVQLNATGRTPRTLASTATGRVLVTQGPGRMQSNLASRLSADLLAELAATLNPFAAREEYTELQCSVLAVDVKDGDAKVDMMLAQSDKIQIVGGGGLDLDTERLNLEFNTKPRRGIGVSADMFVTPFVTLQGSLAQPRVGLNEKGMLLQGGAAVMTGGLSILASALFDRATGAQDACEKAMEHVGGH